MTKEDKYKSLLPQVKALCEGETDMIAKMANVSALLHAEFGFWWTGFYRVINDELLLGPFQGPIACVHIAYGRGVCGSAWKERRTVVVPDVEEFPGHIACSSESRSEIVVPVFSPLLPGEGSGVRLSPLLPGEPQRDSGARILPSPPGEGSGVRLGVRPVVAVLDIDSRQLATFDDTDRRYLEEVVKFIV